MKVFAILTLAVAAASAASLHKQLKCAKHSESCNSNVSPPMGCCDGLRCTTTRLDSIGVWGLCVKDE